MESPLCKIEVVSILCLKSCVNHPVPLINAFILNSPSTWNCPVTGPTLADQSNPVSKPNPNQILNQGVSLPTDTLILSSSSLSSVTSTPTAQGTQQRSSSSHNTVTQSHETCHLSVQLPTPLSRLWVRAATLLLYVVQPWSNAKDFSPLRSVEIFSWLEGVSQSSAVELGKEAKL